MKIGFAYSKTKLPWERIPIPSDVKEIQWASGYFVSPNGEIYSTRKGVTKRVRSFKNTYGYDVFSIYVDGVQRQRFVHRVVAELFCDKPHGFEYVNHKDANKDNNASSNLEWCTQSMNIAHSRGNLLQKKGRYSWNLDVSDVLFMRLLRSYGMQYKQIAKEMGVAQMTARHICTGHNWGWV